MVWKTSELEKVSLGKEMASFKSSKVKKAIIYKENDFWIYFRNQKKKKKKKKKKNLKHFNILKYQFWDSFGFLELGVVWF